MGHCFQNLFSLAHLCQPYYNSPPSCVFLVCFPYHGTLTSRRPFSFWSQGTAYLFIQVPTAKMDVYDKIKAFHWPFILEIIGTNLLRCINFVSLNLSSKYLNTHLAILGPSPESWLTWNNNEAPWQFSTYCFNSFFNCILFLIQESKVINYQETAATILSTVLLSSLWL